MGTRAREHEVTVRLRGGSSPARPLFTLHTTTPPPSPIKVRRPTSKAVPQTHPQDIKVCANAVVVVVGVTPTSAGIERERAREIVGGSHSLRFHEPSVPVL
ncbi:unnamed protein product [Mesocestoides corti]|uniref:Uncharacterized protein n=1 Tax=Mesocestoides corti TaxID=53468 RepID=A0A0R3UQD2_MESCO|nr:unnamed protein product [Mesocestoides corti]